MADLIHDCKNCRYNDGTDFCQAPDLWEWDKELNQCKTWKSKEDEHG